MKTDNLEPDGSRAGAVARGRKANPRAGGTLRVVAGGVDLNVSTLNIDGATITDLDDDEAILTIGESVGEVTPDGSPFTISSGTSWRGFPGAAWLDNPTASVHAVGDRFLIVYREGTGHLTGGDIKGVICTTTDDDPWTYTVGSPFIIENVANDLRVDDAVSVIDGVAVIAAREYNGTVNLSPHILISDVASDLITTSTSWSRKTGPTWNGTQQNLTSGRVIKLPSGSYLVGIIKQSAGTWSAGVAISTDLYDWSSPTFVTIAAGYTEVNVNVLADGTLRAHLRNTASDAHYYSTSADGTSWTAPALMFTADGYPMFRQLLSGLYLTVYRSEAAAQDTAYRQSIDAASWTDETILDATGNDNAYATILQLDAAHALVIYAIENSGSTSTDSDIYSQVFTDDSAFTGLVSVSAGDDAAGFLSDKLVAGTGIELTVLNEGALESIEIGLSASAQGHYEVIVSGSAPPVAVSNPADDDWLYGFVPD